MSLTFHSQAHDLTGEINQRGEVKITLSDSWGDQPESKGAAEGVAAQGTHQKQCEMS